MTDHHRSEEESELELREPRLSGRETVTREGQGGGGGCCVCVRRIRTATIQASTASPCSPTSSTSTPRGTKDGGDSDRSIDRPLKDGLNSALGDRHSCNGERCSSMLAGTESVLDDETEENRVVSFIRTKRERKREI
jgi:hypothetical protein